MKTTIVSSGKLCGGLNLSATYYIPEMALADLKEAIRKTDLKILTETKRKKRLESLMKDIEKKVEAGEPMGQETREQLLRHGIGGNR